MSLRSSAVPALLAPVPRPPAVRDWRLVPGALVVCLAALVGLLVHWSLAVAIGVLASLAGAVVVRRSARVPTEPSRLSAGWPLVVCGLLAVWPIGSRIEEAAVDPLRADAARLASGEFHLVVAARPKQVRGTGFGSMPSGVRSVVVPSVVVGAASRVLVLAPVEGWAGLLPGQEVVAFGTLAPADSGTLTVALLRVRGPPSSVGEAPGWQRATHSLRLGLRAAADVLDAEAAGLLPALVVGDTDRMSQSVEDDFRAAGMSHLLAVSGANLAIVCVAVLYLLRLLQFGPRGSAVGAFVALVGYVVLAGPEPSVLRAGVMGAVGLLALALGRERSALPALAAAVILLVAHDPEMAVSFGFVLSVLATGALVLLAPHWVDRLTRRRVPRVLAEALVVPAAAHLATAPVVAGMSGQVSLIAVLANLLAAPVVAPATVLGLVAALVMPVLPWVAEWLARFAGPEVDWLLLVGHRAAGVPGASITWPSGWWGGVLLVVVLACAAVALHLRGLRVAVGLVLGGVLLALIPIRILSPGWPPAGWVAVACDVGQGDAVALSTTDKGRVVLVDTGPDPAPVRECLDRLGVDRVPLVVLSHLHADHVGGLAAVLAGRSVGAVAVGPGRAPDWAWRQVRQEAANARVPVVRLVAGQRLSWPGLALEVLAPQGKEDDLVEPGGRSAPDGTAINNRSVVLRATTTAGRILLTGDVELDAQADLLTSGVDLSAEVIKVPHHGSRYSAPDFLAAVGAQVAVVSVGAGNRYGHPSPRTVTELARRGALVVRTDQRGDCAVVDDGGKPAVVARGDPRSPP
ncbi:ComEC/Rec2 family competence protein [Actinokineospora sp. NBRC 105648]|uniref:ComEC/Rec2 family competence protein n=1 Tax=Actinokineospora sp. NBRC 105648 TaxID=3032206 RepID=UPI00249FD530|nr:ComEC/Rec2 family competence protein [Actinokineospora sp. NBRC 105648]GLZ39656.1 competence protein ComEC [Actinokineospora sp. NBRC 105648]